MEQRPCKGAGQVGYLNEKYILSGSDKCNAYLDVSKSWFGIKKFKSDVDVKNH